MDAERLPPGVKSVGRSTSNPNPSSHGPDCDCQRCGRGFAPGNELATRHGAYSSVARLRGDERTRELVDAVESAAPVKSSSDSPLIDLVGIALRRAEAAAEAISSGSSSSERIERDLAKWVREAARLLAELGMSPRSRAELGLSIAELEQRRRRRLDLSRLSDEESAMLRRLLEKASPEPVSIEDEPDF